MAASEMEFVNLHRHSEFSPLDGTGNANQYAEQASTVLQQKWLGLTDHGGLGGALDHVRACRVTDDDIDSELRPGEKRTKDEAILPIVGCEVFWVGGDPYGSRLEKDFDHNVKPHLCLHASGITGWKNLIAIVTQSNIDGFHGVPRVDFELLERHHEGIVVSTACISSPVARLLKAGDYEGAVKFVNKLQSICGDRVWIEIMGHDVDAQRQINPGLVNISQETSAGLIATTDAHAPFKNWTDTQSIVFSLSRRDTMKKIAEKEAAARISGDEVYGKELDSAYLMSADEMVELFEKHHPDIDKSIVVEAVKNTANFARTIKQYVPNRDLKIPRISSSEQEAEETLRAWAEEGFERERELRGDEFIQKEDEYRKQLEFEIETIRKKGTLDYFVLVGKSVREHKAQGGRVGPGRGSAAGCLLSYLIGITGLDPLGYGLLFERFMNPDRKGLPDIDVDFSQADRPKVIQALIDEHGADKVASVITYSTFGPRASVGEVAKYFDVGPNKVEFLDVQKVKETFGTLDKDLLKLVKTNEELAAFAEKYPEAWKHMTRIDDMVKAPSKHASAVLITPDPIVNYGPLQRSKGQGGRPDQMVFAWADRAAFPVVSEYGLFKFDVLGLEELDRHEYACKLIEERTGEKLDLYSMPVRWDPFAADPEVMENFHKGLTLGIFQFGGGGFTQLIKAIRPDTVLDLAAANALYRPGAMEFSFEFAKRKKGEKEADYWHESVIPFLRETFGLVAYQEQVMQICKAMGEFTPGQADDMRKAMSKLYRLPGDEAQKFMERFRSQWDRGCANNGISDEIRDRVWQSILQWGGYGFNKSHSACYALLAYIDMWLKTHYPHEFYAALLTHRGGLSVRDIVREASNMGVKVTAPDINLSDRGFTLDGEKLRYGLLAIKNIGGKAVADIQRGRPYESFQDFIEKQKLPEDAEEGESAFSISDAINLVKAGAFDAIDSRVNLLTEIDKFGGATLYKVEFACGAVKRGVKRDPSIEFQTDPDTGDILHYKSGPRKGEPKRYDPPKCPKHKDQCSWGDAEPYTESWTIANHLHHNTKVKTPRELPRTTHRQPTDRQIAEYENDVLGLSLTDVERGQRLESVLPSIECSGYTLVTSESQLEKFNDKKRIYTGGELVDFKPTKVQNGANKGRDMARFKVAIGNETISCTMFWNAYDDYRDVLEEARFVLVTGTKNTWNEQVSVVVSHLENAEQFTDTEDDE